VPNPRPAAGGDRQVIDNDTVANALTSNVGHCLWTGIATDEHAEVIVDRLSREKMDS
jgi:glycogen debranching enzyme